MKNFLFILLLLCSIAVKAQVLTVYVGQKVTLTDTLEHEVAFGLMFNSSPQLLYIHVDENNSGTIKIAVGNYPPIQGQYPFPADSKIPVTIQNGTNNLRVKASATGQIFTITN